MERDLRSILATHEASSDRVVSLEGSYSKLSGLSLDQDELFRESLRAIEQELYRAAHVLAWAGFIDWLHEQLIAGYLKPLNAARPKWSIKKAEDLRNWGDFQVIEAGKDVKMYAAATMRALHGYLDRRNECAHPSDFFPDLNMTLGYVADLFDRIGRLGSSS